MGKVITDFRGPFAMLTAKGTLRKKLGKPKNPIGWEFSIYAKIMQISKGEKTFTLQSLDAIMQTPSL
tara:strand:- start:1088 stop:1288 length:201 start_codon:yes stop_codon:yes gene_type:complete